MLKGLILLTVGLLAAIIGVVIMLNPGAQGNVGGGGMALVGVLIVIHGLGVVVKGGTPVAMGTTNRGRGSVPGRNGITNRRVIMPRDSRPEPPFRI